MVSLCHAALIPDGSAGGAQAEKSVQGPSGAFTKQRRQSSLITCCKALPRQALLAC